MYTKIKAIVSALVLCLAVLSFTTVGTFEQGGERIAIYQMSADFWQTVYDATKANANPLIEQIDQPAQTTTNPFQTATNPLTSKPTTTQPAQTTQPKQTTTTNPFQTATNPLTGKPTTATTTPPKTTTTTTKPTTTTTTTAKPTTTTTTQPKTTTTTPAATTTTPGTTTANSTGRADPDAANWNIAQLDTAKDVTYLTALEKDVILEMNKFRSNPSKYSKLYIEPRAAYFDGKRYLEPGKNGLITQEGVAPLHECVAELKKAAAVGILKPEPGLTLAARDHSADQGKTGELGHYGADKSDPGDRMKRYGTFSGSWTWGENIIYGPDDARDMVCKFLIDDGVPDRGHRKNMMKPGFMQAGVGFGPHSKYRNICTIDYAAGYTNK